MTDISAEWTNSTQSHSSIGFTAAAHLDPLVSPTAAPSMASPDPPSSPSAAAVTVLVSLYAVIFAIGLVGNGLVVFVVSRYSTMKTVVNRLILNLSVADGVFVLGLPLIITTSLVRRWVFGPALCKIYYALTCVNMFTGSFTLAVMSADRFVAVYFPLSIKRYRTPRNVAYVIAVTWILSLVAMTPAVVFANSVSRSGPLGGQSCTIEWPMDTRAIARIYIVYTFILGFVLPTVVIALSYTLVVVRLRTNTTRMWRRGLSSGGSSSGERKGSTQSRRPRGRNVTGLVFLIVLVYAVCWSPYWSFQVYQIAGTRRQLKYSEVLVFNVFTVLSYANSAINPLLYAFTNDRFRKSFASAFGCGRRGAASEPPLGTGDATAGTRRGTVPRASSGREPMAGGSRKAVELRAKPSADGKGAEIDGTKVVS